MDRIFMKNVATLFVQGNDEASERQKQFNLKCWLKATYGQDKHL